MEEILSLVFRNTNVNFDLYKKSTLERRINKRIAVLNLKGYDDYLSYLQKNKAEVNELFNTILIGVTDFFRDKEAFNALKKTLTALIGQKKEGDDIRIWSVGCANGAEPYSIAILLHEILGERVKDYKIKIFGSDIDNRSIDLARKGVYSEEHLKNCPKSLIAKYFTTSDGGFKIKDFIKEKIIFSLHDINSDPPFLNIDLITCRNLLIYFEKELQNEVVCNFHYCLQHEGYLFLGKSENLSDLQDLFETLDTRNKIFKCIKGYHNTHYNYQSLIGTKLYSYTPDKIELNKKKKSIKESALDVLFKSIDTPFVVVNDRLQILETEGTLRLYLELKSNNKDNNLLKAINKEISFSLHNAFLEARKYATTVETGVLDFTLFKQSYQVQCKVCPFIPEGMKNTHFVISFHKIDSPQLHYHSSVNLSEIDSENEVIQKLKDELQVAKEHLGTYRLEIEKRTQEAQSLNEELQSANEELKSANEELETSNEELQALNEELYNSNSSLTESNRKLLEKEHELLKVNSQLRQHKNHLEIAKDIGEYVSWEYDRDTLETQGTEELLDLLGAYHEDSSYMLSNKWMELVHPEDALVITEKFKDFGKKDNAPVTVQYRINRKDNNELRWLESIAATKDNKVISVIRDITSQKQIQQTLSEEKERYKTLFNNSQYAIFIIGKDLKIKLLNEKSASYLKHDLEHYIGKDITYLDKDNPGVFNRQIEEIISKGSGRRFERKISTAQGERWFQYEIQPIVEATGESQTVQVLSFDITERKVAEEQLIENELNLSQIFDSTDYNQALFEFENGEYILRKINDQLLKTNRILNRNLTKEDCENKDLRTFILDIGQYPEENYEGFKRKLDQIKKTKKAKSYLEKTIEQDIFLETTVIPIFNQEGKCNKFLYISKDVTDRINYENAIKNNEKKYRTLLENSSESVTIIDQNLTITYVSPGHERIFGRGADELIGKKGTLNIHPDFNDTLENLYAKLLKNPGKVFKERLCIKHSQGHFIWIELLGRNLLHNDLIAGIVFNTREITDHIVAQRRIEESENRLKALDEASSEGIFFHANQKLIDCNSAFIKMMGYDSKEEIAQLTLEETAGPYAQFIAEKINSGFEGTYEAGLRRKNGELFPIEIRSRNTYFNGNKGRITQIKDLTERKKIEDKLAEQSAFLKSVIDTIPSYIFLKDKKGKYLIANKALSQLFRLPVKEIIGKKDKEIIPHQELVEKITKEDRKILNSKKIKRYIEEFYLKKNDLRYLHTTKTPLYNTDGEIMGILGISTDVSDRIQAENALLESETKFRAITENSPYATLLLTDELHISYCSKEACSLLQRRIEKIINHSIKDFIPKKSQHLFLHLVNQVEGQPNASITFDNVLIADVDGNEYTCDGFIVKLPSESGVAGYLLEMKDITFIKQEEKKRKLLNQTLLQLSNNKAVHSGDLESALRVITKTSTKALGTSKVSVWVYDSKQQAINMSLMYDNDTKKYTRDHIIYEKDHPDYFEAIIDKRVLTVSDTFNDPSCQSLKEIYFNPTNVKARLDAKFVYDGQFKGIICLEEVGKTREWSIEEQNFVSSLADLITTVWQSHERSLVQAALVKSESEWKSLVDNAPDVILKVNRKKQITFTNRFNKYFTLDEILGTPFDAFAPQEFKSLMNEVVSNVFKTGETGSYEMCMKNPDETTKWYASRVAPIKINDKITEALIYTSDITERKRVEMALKESDIRYKSMIENSTEAIWRFEINPKIKTSLSPKRLAQAIYKNAFIAECNTLTAKLLGKKNARDIINDPLHEHLPKTQELINTFTAFVENNFKVTEIEFPLIMKNGKTKYISMYASGIASKGELTRIWGTFKDVTERKEAEFANERLLKILEASTDFIGMATPSGQALYVNAAGKRILGFDEDIDIQDLTISDFHKGEAAELILHEAFPTAKEKGTWEGLTTMATTDGRNIPFSQLLMSHKDDNGKVIFYSTVARDMTLNKMNQEKMMQSVVKGVDDERKRIASELHDSLGQLLSAASMNLESMKKEAQNFPQLLFKKFQTTISLISNAIIETREISHDLMPKTLEDSGIITSLEAMLEKIEQAAPFEIYFHHFRVPEKMNKTLEINLYRVTQEALNNIIKHAQATEVKIQMIKHRDNIHFSIEDNGIGFEKKDMDFEGHGITNIKNRITSLSGTVTIESAPKKGTTISIEVPFEE